jgi:arylsulfatase
VPAPPARFLLLCALAVVTGCSSAERRGAVLITVDTLRADHVGAYAGADARTPRIDALAREGTVFERAISPLPLTRPAHFSMLTARYPREHGVLNNSTPLPESAQSLPEILREHGWRTAAFTAVRILGTDSGVAQGFERFDGTGPRRQRSGAEVVERAIAWLDELSPGEPFFLWVHLFEPHLPYAPPPAFRTGLAPSRAAALGWDDLQRIAQANAGDIPAPVLEHAQRLYRGEVRAADHWVGELLDGLRARMPLDHVLVLLTADHGECFENGVWFEHSDCLYEGALHVPLVVRHPQDFPAGSRVSEPVSLLDVAPTVLRAAGLPPPEPAAGRPLQETRGSSDRHVLVQYPFYGKDLPERRARNALIRSVAGQPTRGIVTATQWVGVVGPRWKFLARDGSEELYPLAPRADESENRVAEEPAVAAEMRQRLAAELAAHPLGDIAPGEVTAELRRALEALGYVE